MMKKKVSFNLIYYDFTFFVLSHLSIFKVEKLEEDNINMQNSINNMGKKIDALEEDNKIKDKKIEELDIDNKILKKEIVNLNKLLEEKLKLYENPEILEETIGSFKKINSNLNKDQYLEILLLSYRLFFDLVEKSHKEYETLVMECRTFVTNPTEPRRKNLNF